jgi:hypothetical protein
LLQDAHTELFDEFFKIWSKVETHFVQVEKAKHTWYRHRPGAKRVMASVKVRLDPKTVIYGRVADTMLSGLEAIGGFNESLMHIGILFVFFFQERLFKSSFMRQVYMLQSENK